MRISSSPQAPRPSSLPKPAPPPPTMHAVVKGDTLSALARRYSTTVRAIADANGIVDVNRIHIGQRLVIPQQVPSIFTPAPAPAPTTPAVPVGQSSPAQAITAGHVQIGYNTLQFTDKAEEQYQAGARFFLSMDDVTGAQAFKRRHPDAIVMVRVYTNRDSLRTGTPEQLADRLGVGPDDPGLIYVGTNEDDIYGHRGDALRERARFDLELAEVIKRRSGGKAKFAAGTFSMGCPDFTNPEDVAIIKELYAPAYNRGDIVFDMHTYSPTIEHIDDEGGLTWYERRWEQLFTKAGFDPKVRGIYSSETGLDEPGVGGFPAHDNAEQLERFKAHHLKVYGRPFEGGYPEFVAHWVRRYKEISARPLTVNGREYASPYVGGALFQLGNTRSGGGGWAGYSLQPYTAAVASTATPELAGQAILGQHGEAPLPAVPVAPPAVPVGPVAPGSSSSLEDYAAARQLDLGRPAGQRVFAGHRALVFEGGRDSVGRPALVVDGPEGPRLVRTGFRDTYVRPGMAERLGAPLGEEEATAFGTRQRFEHGTLTWSAGTGVVLLPD